MWRVPRMWEGGECWILGGGPSMPKQFGVPEQIIQSVVNGEKTPAAYSPYFSLIHNKHVVGINVAYLIGDWIDIVFFGDNKFFLEHRAGMARHPGLKVSCHPKMDTPKVDWVRYLARDKKHARGISDNPRMVSWNGNSGAAAISMVVNAGVKRIILLGFDMKLDEKEKQHWHTLYQKNKVRETRPGKMIKSLPFDRHLRGFPDIARDAKRRGVEIINASPDSAIKQFPKMTVREILGESAWIKRVAGGVLPIPNPIEPGKRFEWLIKKINKNGYKIGVEVGCARGRTTRELLEHCKDLFLYLVDLWQPMPKDMEGGTQYRDWDFNKVKRLFDKSIQPFPKERYKILRGLSWEMANEIEDNSLDFVFIDADHEHSSVIKDIKAWTPKLKPGGMLCGHDIHFDGVKTAVELLIPNYIHVGVDHVWECKKEDVKC